MKEKAHDILEEPEAVKLLLFARKAPRSPEEISRNLNLPISNCYKILGKLKKLKLVEEAESYIDSRGVTRYRYRSMLGNAYIRVERGGVKIRLANYLDSLPMSYARSR